MSLIGSSVTLTYEIGGVLTSYGSYDYKERTTSGSIIPEEQRLFIKKHPEYSNCFKVVKLGEAFVNFAISEESRPSRDGSYSEFKAWHSWMRMSQKQRLEYHLKQYVVNFRGKNFSYEIHKL